MQCVIVYNHHKILSDCRKNDKQVMLKQPKHGEKIQSDEGWCGQAEGGHVIGVLGWCGYQSQAFTYVSCCVFSFQSLDQGIVDNGETVFLSK